MSSQAISHGQTVRADLEQVEVSSKAGGEALVYFCGIRNLTVLETIAPGDGGPLPRDVEISGLEVPREGMYNIRNALITSNGRVDVRLDDESRVAPAGGLLGRLGLYV